MPPEIFCYFRALRQLLAQSELIELLNIYFIDHNTDLVLWLTYCMKISFRVQTCPKSAPPPPPPFSYTTDC